MNGNQPLGIILFRILQNIVLKNQKIILETFQNLLSLQTPFDTAPAPCLLPLKSSQDAWELVYVHQRVSRISAILQIFKYIYLYIYTIYILLFGKCILLH